jgi:hypothetical protein
MADLYHPYIRIFKKLFPVSIALEYSFLFVTSGSNVLKAPGYDIFKGRAMADPPLYFTKDQLS